MMTFIRPRRTAGLLVAFILSLAACTPAADTVADTDTKVRVDERMATDISPTDVFTQDSIGSTKIGDTFDPRKLNRVDDNFENCFFAENSAIPTVNYLIINDKVAKITTSDSNVASSTGVRVGDSLSEIISKHQNQTPEIVDSPFSLADSKLITMYYWTVQEGQRVGTRYDLLNEKVISISIGNDDSLMSQEGCA